MKLSLDSLAADVSIKQPDSVWDHKPNQINDRKSLWTEAVVETARQYCYTTVLHGVKYLAEPRRPHLERFTWSMVLLGLFGIALHLIWITSVADLNSPLLISLESSNYPIWNFRFPAVTLCPVNKLNRTVAEEWARRMKLPETMSSQQLIDLLPNILHLIDFSDSPNVRLLDSVLEMNQVEADDLYLNLSVPCKHLLIQCRLQGELLPCQHIFKTIRTTEGYCCSFNYFGVSSQFNLNRYHEKSNVTPTSAWRSVANGVNSGISVIVKATGGSYGALMSSLGTKVLLHVPSNYPGLLSIARLVQPGHSEHFALSPTLIAAGPDIRVIPPGRRECTFFDEMKLRGFEEYAYNNCIFNCRLTFFQKLCACVPFYYPAHLADGFRTCRLRDNSCLSQFKYEIQTMRMNLSADVREDDETPPCGCRPQCNELSYAVATYTYAIHDDLITSKHGDMKTFGEYAEVNVYFKALFGTLYQRVLPSTTYQMLANFGGLLGLFMGFSFTSAFEIIYSFSLRILFRVYVASRQRVSASSPRPEIIVIQPYD